MNMVFQPARRVPSRRVVLTGVGMVSPLGIDEDGVWQRLVSGTTAIAPLRNLDPADYKTGIGAEVDSPLLAARLAAMGARPIDRTVDMAIVACDGALRQAGLRSGTADAGSKRPPLPAAVILGTGIGASHSLYETFSAYAARGGRGMRPTAVPRCMANAISAHLSIRFTLCGPNYVIVSACSSATTAIGTAFRMIRNGDTDLAVAGGADAPFDPFVYAGWNNLGVLSKNTEPGAACRPFDRDRDGFVLGEGAGLFVIEALESARARGARIRAEILGFGESSDATHLTQPSPEGQAQAMTAALRSAGIDPGEIDLINAHGTATQASDASECRAIRQALGAAADTALTVSCKPFIGHTLGASGALETLFTLLCMEHAKVHANLNLDHPDPVCDLALAPPRPVDRTIRTALNNSFGFGGNNAVLVLRHPVDPDPEGT